MTHSPIHIQNFSLSCTQKLFFEHFSTSIYYGSRIALIGHNGCGKSTFINKLHKASEKIHSAIHIPYNVQLGYVPQLIYEPPLSSGSERFQHALSLALALDPNVLLLDEPTNHLDFISRKNLMKKLNSFSGTLITSSHDPDFLRSCITTLWHIDQKKIHIFKGNYDDYLLERKTKKISIEKSLKTLEQKKKEMH